MTDLDESGERTFATDSLGQSQRPAGRAENDFLPQELMVALRQTALPAEYLGPPGVTNINKLLRPMPPVCKPIFPFIAFKIIFSYSIGSCTSSRQCMELSKTTRKISLSSRSKSLHLWSRTVSFNFQCLPFSYLLFSDISFLCEATTALTSQHQQNKPSLSQRTTDKSAIRAIPTELQQEPVCSNLEVKNLFN